MKRLILVPLIVILAFALVFSGCGDGETDVTTGPTTATGTPTSTEPTEPTTEGPQTGGILRMIVTQGPQGSLGMPENMAGNFTLFSTPVMDQLLKTDQDGDIVECLATDWEWSNDYTTLTLTLRQGVRFHDGTDFNAQAVLWNFDRHMAAGTVGTENIVSYEALDDYTFRINTKEYKTTWIEKISEGGYTLGVIVSPTAVEEYGEEYVDWHPVGTGPFKFKGYKRDEYVELERNDDYWGSPQPYLDGIKFIIIVDPVTAQMSFEAGDADVYWAIMQGHVAAHDLVPKGYASQSDHGANLMYVLIPSSGNPDSPLANPKVRMAIDYAIDKEKIAETLFYGYAQPRIQMVGTQQISEPADVGGRLFDPDKARELLAEADYEGGFPLTIYCGTHFAGDDKVMVQSYLNDVGIDTSLEYITPNKWIDMETNGWDEGILVSVQGGSMGMFLDRFWWYPDEPNWERGLYYHAVDRPAALQTMIEEYLVTPGEEAQLALAQEIGQLMYDECIAIPLYENWEVYVMQDNVRDAKWDDPEYPTPWSFTDIWLSQG